MASEVQGAGLGRAWQLQQRGCAERSASTRAFQGWLASLSRAAPAVPPQFVLTTDPSVGSMQEQLQHIYAAMFVELVVKNPLYTPGEAFL